MAERRAAGEPLQYIFGHWPFRGLDLRVDPRVLIPRPETEQVVEVALGEARRPAGRLGEFRSRRRRRGDGQRCDRAGAGHRARSRHGAGGLGHRHQPGALTVAACNLEACRVAGAGVDAGALPRVELAEGSWLEPLPARLLGRVDLVVSNPPYVAESEWPGLAAEVRAEPRSALVAGPGRSGVAGLADVEAVLGEARRWLGRPGALVVELAPHQAGAGAAPGAATQVRRGTGRIGLDGPAPRPGGAAGLLDNRTMDDADDFEKARPPLVAAGATAVLDALGAGAIVAVPNVGGYSLAVRAGSSADEARLVELAADTDGPHYAVGQIDDVRALTTGWTDELGTLLQRCWPGPVEVFLPRAGLPGSGPDSAGDAPAGPGVPGSPDGVAAENGAWAIVVGMPEGRALRRLCREQGPWRTVPLRFTEATEVAQAFGADDVALVIDGGSREGPTPTVVDATVTPIRVLREGALPASFIEGTMLMSTRRRLFSRTKRPGAV